jgi:hypothetical protein
MSLFRLLLVLSLLSPFTWRAATDEGNGFDPHGTPRPASLTCDEGSGLDPHGGRCNQTNALDEGWLIDPNG